MNLVNMQTKRFDLTRDLVIDVSRDFVGPLILSHQSAKFGVHRPCESGNITFFICPVTLILKCHLTLWLGSPHPKLLIG